MKKPDSTVAPISLGMGVIIVTLYCSDGSTVVIEPSDRSLVTAYNLAKKELLIYPHGYYESVEVCSLLRDGNKVPFHSPLIASWDIIRDIFPYYVKWELDQGMQCKRFVKRTDAMRLYNDLVRQDILVLSTNAHPLRSNNNGK